MKKIISILAAATMLFSSVTALAAAPAGVQPTAKVKLTDLNKTNSDGIRKQYQLEIDLENLGNLSAEGFRVSVFSTKIAGNISKIGTLPVTYTVGEPGVYANATEDNNGYNGIIVEFVNPAANKAYPLAGTTTTCDDAFVFKFWGVPGEKITVNALEVGYNEYYYVEDDEAVYMVPGDATEYVMATPDVTEIVLPGAEPANKKVEFSAALAEKTDFGYIWALTFTQSADKLASFTAKFEADGVEPAERTVANASDIATALKGKTAPIVLNVGLSTTKTLTKATFTADDAVDTTEACVFVAPLSK